MTIEQIPGEFCICKLPDGAAVDLTRPFHFFARTDREISLVCPAEFAPTGALECDGSWRTLRVAGTLDFSLIGVLAHISTLLAEADVGIFVVSTYDTDYILTKSTNYERALAALRAGGCDVCEAREGRERR